MEKQMREFIEAVKKFEKLVQSLNNDKIYRRTYFACQGLDDISYHYDDGDIEFVECSESTELGKTIQDIEYGAAGLFITEKGQADFGKMELLKRESGGSVWIIKGEADSFGWLTGVVCTSSGRIVYG